MLRVGRLRLGFFWRRWLLHLQALSGDQLPHRRRDEKLQEEDGKGGLVHLFLEHPRYRPHLEVRLRFHLRRRILLWRCPASWFEIRRRYSRTRRREGE